MPKQLTAATLIEYLQTQDPDAIILTGTRCIAEYVWTLTTDDIYAGTPRKQPPYVDIDIKHYDQPVIVL